MSVSAILVLASLLHGMVRSPSTATPIERDAAEVYRVTGGRVKIQLDGAFARSAGLAFGMSVGGSMEFAVAERGVPLLLRAADGDWRGGDGGGVALIGPVPGFRIDGARRAAGRGFRLEHDCSGNRTGEFVLVTEGPGGMVWFELCAERPALRTEIGQAVVLAEVRLAPELAERLRIGAASGAWLGQAAIHWDMVRVDSGSFLDSAAESVPAAVAEGMSSEGPSIAGQLSGPDVVAAAVGAPIQFGRVGVLGSGTVGLALATASCNMGTVAVNWSRLPSTDHPLIVQNLYRMRLEDGSARFEQIGQAWLKHSFSTLENSFCGVTCFPLPGDQQLGVGCYDPYGASTNANVCNLGPRSGVNPFTGVFAGGANLGSGGNCATNFPARNHVGHVHDGISHKLQVGDVDLLPPLSDGARYFSEGQYLVPHEYRERAASGSASLFNNVSYSEAENQGPGGVTGDVFSFVLVSGTYLEEPAIHAWTGATRTVVEPAAGDDGRAILACEVTKLGDNKWHYEYGIYNMNLDRAVAAFRVPVPPGVQVTNIGFHAPLNHDSEPNAETWSNDPWMATVADGWIEWTTDAFAVDPLANAVRFGTLYNFRFDADAPPIDVQTAIDTFKVAATVPAAARGPAPVLPPRIVHGAPGVSFGQHAFGGFVDARSESSNGMSLDRGPDELMVHFDQPVRALGGAALSPADFEVRETGGGDPPTITGVDFESPVSVRLSFSRPMTPTEWTTVQAFVEGMGGIPIVSAGDLGPGTIESDRIDVGFLPCDVDGNGRVEPVDLIRYRQYAAGTTGPLMGTTTDYLDMNRDGVFQPVDLIAFRQALAGTGEATRIWLGASVSAPQP